MNCMIVLAVLTLGSAFHDLGKVPISRPPTQSGKQQDQGGPNPQQPPVEVNVIMCRQDDAGVRESKTGLSDLATIGLTALLVIVGFLQVAILAWQAVVFRRTLKAVSLQGKIMRQQSRHLCASVREAANATKAIRDNVNLQILTMRQWLTLAGWTANYFVVENSNKKVLRIDVNLLNPTTRPVTVKEISFRFRIGINYIRNIQTLLVPQVPYAIFMGIPITEEEAEQYLNTILRIGVTCKIIFVDSLGDSQEQDFTGLLTLNKNRTEFRLTNALQREEPPSQDNNDIGLHPNRP